MNGLGGTMQPLDYPGPLAPEPASIVMLLGGLVAFASVRLIR